MVGITAAFREETPGACEVVHLNAAGAALPPRSVTAAMIAHLEREAAIGPHWAVAEARDRIDAVRTTAATVLGCGERNVAFGSSAGRLWAMALLGHRIPPSARILVARSEWASNMVNLLRLRHSQAIHVDVMPTDDRTGLIDVAEVENLIDERTVAICLPLVASGRGDRQPVESLAALPRPDGALMFLDAAQAVGNMPVDLREMGADIMVASARKWMRGPRGEGVMALSDRALRLCGEPPLLDQAGAPWTGSHEYTLHPDGRRFETFEFSPAGRLGFGAAFKVALEFGVDNIREVILARLRRLHAGLAAVPGIKVFERLEGNPAFLTFTSDSLDPGVLSRHLADRGIAIATVDRSYARLDFEARGLTAVNRVAPHAYTSEEDVERFLEAVAAICGTSIANESRHEAGERTLWI